MVGKYALGVIKKPLASPTSLFYHFAQFYIWSQRSGLIPFSKYLVILSTDRSFIVAIFLDCSQLFALKKMQDLKILSSAGSGHSNRKGNVRDKLIQTWPT